MMKRISSVIYKLMDENGAEKRSFKAEQDVVNCEYFKIAEIELS